MLCCVGLIAGSVVGQALGGPWTIIAPAAGFGLGLIGDMKFMKECHMKGTQPNPGVQAKKDAGPVGGGMEVNESKVGRQAENMGKT